MAVQAPDLIQVKHMGRSDHANAAGLFGCRKV